MENRLGKNALSFSWARNTIVTKAEALKELDKMIAKLTKSEADDRADAIKKVKRFINATPSSGVDAYSILHWGNKENDAKRIDIEVISGKAFSNQLRGNS